MWANDAKSPTVTLRATVNAIWKAYNMYPGGVDAVPKTYAPEDIPKIDAKASDDQTENGDDEGPTNGGLPSVGEILSLGRQKRKRNFSKVFSERSPPPQRRPNRKLKMTPWTLFTRRLRGSVIGRRSWRR